MAYNTQKIEHLEQKAQSINLLRYLRYAFYFYAFLSFVFWFLQCLDADWLYHFNFLFILPYQFVQIFYKIKPDSLHLDFTLVIIGIISLIIGAIIDFGGNFLYEKTLDQIDIEERKIQQRNSQKRRIEAKPIDINPAIYNSTQQENTDNENKLLFIIQVHTNKIKRKENDIELTFQEVEIWKQRVVKKLIENINYSKPMQKGYYRKNLFLVYRDFNFVDDFVYYIRPTIDSIKMEFRKYGISVSFNYVLSAILKIENLEKELDCMDTILSLNFQNEFITTNRFKFIYDNRASKKYKLKMKGEYNLSKNLTITNNQPLFNLIDIQQGEKHANENNKNGT